MKKTTLPPKRRRWWVTVLKAAAFLIAALLSLVALTIAWCYFQGRNDWVRTKAELQARGEKLSYAELLPSPLPDSQNFFADPLWQELGDLAEVEESGRKMKAVRLPKGQRRIDGLDRSLTDAERVKLWARFPEFASAGAEGTMGELIRQIAPPFEMANPPGDRRAAEFVLALFALDNPVLSRLDELAERPGASSKTTSLDDIDRRTTTIHYLIAYSQMLRARAWAEVTLGNIPAAKADVLRLLQVTRASASEPLLISFLVQLTFGGLALDPIDYGVKARAWTAQDLELFERELGQLDFLLAFSSALRGERGHYNQAIETALNLPSGMRAYLWMRGYLFIFGSGDQAYSNRFFQQWIDALDAYPKGGLKIEPFSMEKIEKMKANAITRYRYAFVAVPTMPVIVSAAAELQNHVQNTRTACALELYRLKHGSYPTTLQELVPEILPALPKDVITLQPMQYRLESPDKFILWSPGWGGTGKNGLPDPDWVWQ